MAYAAYSRSSSRYSRRSARSVVARATTPLRRPIATDRHQPTSAMEAGGAALAGATVTPGSPANIAAASAWRAQDWRRRRETRLERSADDAFLGDDAGDELGRA